MNTQATRPYTHYDSTLSICPVCRKVVAGRIFFENGKVYLRKACPEHGAVEALIFGDASLFLRTEQMIRPGQSPLKFSASSRSGCPSDCGVCPEHEQRCAIPVIEITNHCNLECPICFAYNNANYHMSLDELERCLDRIVECEDHDIDVLVLSGGEPTVHPQFCEVVNRCVRRRFKRVAVNTNGVRLAGDRELAAFLAESGVHVTLQFDTLRPETCRRLRGRDLVPVKHQALARCAEFRLKLNLLQTVVKGINDDEVGALANFALKGRDHVCGLNIHIMTYTGKGGSRFPVDPRDTLTGPDVLAALETQSEGLLRESDFLPLPFPHPRCALITYAVTDGQGFYPLPRFMSPDRYLPLLTKGAIGAPEADFKVALEQTIDELWAGGDPASPPVLRLFRQLLLELFPRERVLDAAETKRISEKYFRTVFVHSYMDEYTFDLNRSRKCCSMQVLPDGRMIPNCAYYVIHRHSDPRFFPSRCY